ncbi:MAG: DUF1080 domain-containing protein [Rhodothermaceae bacterium]|nr:DUF1080 domain-containing protein [Rhodothermaceae bacterium]
MKIVIVFILLFFSSLNLFAQNVERPISMNQDNWEAAAGRAEFITHRGVPAMKVTPNPEVLFSQPGQVVLKDVQFAEGTIEFDVELTDFFLSAIYFRRQNAENAEVFYIRTYRADDPTGPDAIQYTELIKGVALWDLHPRYQGPAEIKKEGWNHIKLVISGQRMNVYVNDMDTPSLSIPQLMGATDPGSIAFEGGGIFSNLVIKPGLTEGITPEPAYDPESTDSRYIHQWQASESFSLPPGRELVSAMLFRAYSDHFPGDETVWQSIETERGGLVNLSRRFGRSDERRAVWLKTKIHSNNEQQRTLRLGFSDEVWVLLNDKLVYVDKNLYSHPIMKDAFGQISVDDASVTLPLLEGENELLIGVANSFFGWAIMAQLENTDGLRVDIK